MVGLILVAAAISLGWGMVAIRLGPRIGYVDAPGEDPLKSHARPAVPLGGVGVFFGVHAGLLLDGTFEPVLIAATVLVLALGLVDDRRALTPGVRLMVWGLAALMIAVTVDPHGGVTAGILIGALVIVTINALNLFDGLDGLAGSSAMVAAVGIAILSQARDADGTLPALVAAALAGFLVLNWHPARLFLGDSGAYVVGVLLAWGIVATSPRGGGDLVVAAGVLGVFAIDLVVTVIRRAGGRRPLFTGDRGHVYDQLHERGWSVPGIAFSAAAVQAVLVAGVVLADRFLSSAIGAAAVVGMLATLVGGLVLAGFTRMAD